MRTKVHQRQIQVAATAISLAFCLGAAPIQAQTKMTPGKVGHSNSVLGVPVGSLHGFQGEPSAAKAPSAAAPGVTFYGDTPPGGYRNTDQFNGPTSTLQPGVDIPRPETAGPVQNPNTVISNAQGPVSNGTGAPLKEDTTIPVPVQETGVAENPQESQSAIVWIVICTALTIGTVFGLVKLTQPGGVA